MVVENQFEQFFINLREYESAVILNGPTASVTIEDNDSELFTYASGCQYIYEVNLFSTSVVTIGFNGTYSVHEDTGVIFVLVLMNSLARDVVVTVSTLNDTARGGFAQGLTCTDQY